MINREFPFNQPIHPVDNLSINKVFDRNYGNKLKSGDTTTLKYTIKDGDGEPLDNDKLLAMEKKAVLKYDNLVAYETNFNAEIEGQQLDYDGDLVARFKVEEVLPPSDKPYIVEFHFEDAADGERYIFPSNNTLELFITPSSLNADDEAIVRASEGRLDSAVAKQLEHNIVLKDAEEQELQRQAAEAERQSNYDELVDTGIMQENINQKLAESETEYAPRLTQLEQNDADLTAQLAQKATKGEIQKNDYDLSKDINKWNINDFDEETRQTFLEAQGIAVDYVLGDGNVVNDNIAKKAVSYEKTDFITHGKNLFDKSRAVHQKQLALAGDSLFDSKTSYVTPFIEVYPGDIITLSTSYRLAFYYADKTVDSVINTNIDYTGSSSMPRTVTVPNDVFFIRASSNYENHNNVTIDDFQIEKNDTETYYEPFYNNIFSKAENDVEKYIHGIRNNTTQLIRQDGIVVAIEEMKGNKIVSKTLLNRDENGNVTGTTKTIDGKQVSTTYNKDINGNLISITREVV